MKQLLITLVILILVSCSHELQQINYGKDICENCKMTIMDMKFGGELINKNGKTLKFDSGECMVKYLSSHPKFIPAKYMIVDFAHPGTLIEANKAVYLMGGNVISPMGGALAAFASNDEAEKTKLILGGSINLWKTISRLQF